MKLLLACLLSALLLAGLGAWLRRAWAQAGPGLRPWLLAALLERLLLTAGSIRYPGPDARYAFLYAQAFLEQFWQHPGRALALLTGNRLYGLTGESEAVYQWSPTLFYDKLLAVLALATNGQRWLTTLYLSLGCFVAAWSLLAVVQRVVPRVPVLASLLAFLLWPTVLWWTGGLSKETVLLGAGMGVVALALPLLYGPAPARQASWGLVGRLLALLLLAWLMARVRYFFALPLLGGLLALAGVQLASRRGWLSSRWPAQVGALLGLLLAQLVLAKTLGGRLMEVPYFVQEVNLNYLHGLTTSAGRPHLEYAHWQASAGRLLLYAPLAVWHTLTRPWLGEASSWLYAGAALENLLLLALLARAGWAGLRGRRGGLPVALAATLLLYCLLLAAFIGLSTPNLGTLSRYRSVLLPWLLWLCLVKWRDGEIVSSGAYPAGR